MSELNEFEERILANIREHGCQVNHVFDPDGVLPGKSYSIGFPETIDQPEVIVFGLPSEVMKFMINDLLRQCREEGLSLHDGLVVSDLLEGFDCIARIVQSEHIIADHFASAMWFSEHRFQTEMKDAFQIVWPSSVAGLFPWDEGVAQDVIDAQPALYEAAA
ncbi:MAG: DUF4262 domain-containing protein [Pseudomonadota bacterium]